ncbi:MAG: hypothetical protein R3D67_05960 [Hyphomicrobiaceae bacterium]
MSIPSEETGSLREKPVRYVAEEVITSAQNLEDVLLFRVFGGKHTGAYVDVGAGDPNWDSVTFWFYRCGWRGLNIEANPLFVPTYALFRPDDINLQVGVAQRASAMNFYKVIQNAAGHGGGCLRSTRRHCKSRVTLKRI